MPSITGSAIPATAVPPFAATPPLADLMPPVLDPAPVGEDVLATPWRCRLGLHHWVPLALSLSGARRSLGISFCCRCPAVRRPA